MKAPVGGSSFRWNPLEHMYYNSLRCVLASDRWGQYSSVAKGPTLDVASVQSGSEGKDQPPHQKVLLESTIATLCIEIPKWERQVSTLDIIHGNF